MEQACNESVLNQSQAVELTSAVLGVQPLRAIHQLLTSSGNAVFRVDLPDKRSVVLRNSPRPNSFACTKQNLDVLRGLGLPVQTVLSVGSTFNGGSYIILDWLPGRDLLYEFRAMTPKQMTRLAEQWIDFQNRVGALPEAAGFGWAPVGRYGKLKAWTQVFGEAGPAPLTEDPTTLGRLRARLRNIRFGLEPYFRTIRPCCFLHDLILKNVLIEDGALSGIIDVDFACNGDPLLALGNTLAAIVADVGESGNFYGKELIRLWNPNGEQTKAICFYAALWATGILSMTNAKTQPDRASDLTNAADAWLNQAENMPV
jgi:aminoglycoside phosphotransferase (APT) family kinase protein